MTSPQTAQENKLAMKLGHYKKYDRLNHQAIMPRQSGRPDLKGKQPESVHPTVAVTRTLHHKVHNQKSAGTAIGRRLVMADSKSSIDSDADIKTDDEVQSPCHKRDSADDMMPSTIKAVAQVLAPAVANILAVSPPWRNEHWEGPGMQQIRQTQLQEKISELREERRFIMISWWAQWTSVMLTWLLAEKTTPVLARDFGHHHRHQLHVAWSRWSGHFEIIQRR